MAHWGQTSLSSKMQVEHLSDELGREKGQVRPFIYKGLYWGETGGEGTPSKLKKGGEVPFPNRVGCL